MFELGCFLVQGYVKNLRYIWYRQELSENFLFRLQQHLFFFFCRRQLCWQQGTIKQLNINPLRRRFKCGKLKLYIILAGCISLFGALTFAIVSPRHSLRYKGEFKRGKKADFCTYHLLCLIKCNQSQIARADLKCDIFNFLYVFFFCVCSRYYIHTSTCMHLCALSVRNVLQFALSRN